MHPLLLRSSASWARHVHFRTTTRSSAEAGLDATSSAPALTLSEDPHRETGWLDVPTAAPSSQFAIPLSYSFDVGIAFRGLYSVLRTFFPRPAVTKYICSIPVCSRVPPNSQYEVVPGGASLLLGRGLFYRAFAHSCQMWGNLFYQLLQNTNTDPVLDQARYDHVVRTASKQILLQFSKGKGRLGSRVYLPVVQYVKEPG